VSNDANDTTQILRLDLPAPPSVLIVDDDPLVLARLQALVADAGYSAHGATSGIDALEWLEQSRASIVITDLNMPGMDGLELCRRIRAKTWPGYVYLVLLTIRDEEKDILAGLDAGADDYLSKRVSTAQFTARLRTAKRILTLEYSLKSALESKRLLAMTDALTGIYNRRYFLRHLSRELKRVQRFGGDLSLLLFDIDHFKQVNDVHGHAIGDDVLKALTTACTECLRRDTDWSARLGGDEFAVVLEGTGLAEAGACAKALLRAISDVSVSTGSESIQVTASIGVGGLQAAGSREFATVQSLMESADTALYASKLRGRNCVTVADVKPSRPLAGISNQQRGSHDNAKMSVNSLR
jgi:two-component system, cell cycle response regulator